MVSVLLVVQIDTLVVKRSDVHISGLVARLHLILVALNGSIGFFLPVHLFLLVLKDGDLLVFVEQGHLVVVHIGLFELVLIFLVVLGLSPWRVDLLVHVPLVFLLLSLKVGLVIVGQRFSRVVAFHDF